MPLRWRLSLITAGLILVALVLTGTAVVALVRNSLMQQVDDQLFEAAQSYADDVSGSVMRECPPEQPPRPTDYFVHVELYNGCAFRIEATTIGDGIQPALPDLAEPLGAGEEFTVASTSGSTLWRVGSYALVSPSGEVGTMMIAVPMTSVLKTVSNLIRTMALVGLGVVIAGALAGYWAVQKSLRPLRDIETAAGAVAAGNLSQRAPVQPPTTEVGRLGLSFNAMVAELERSFAERQASEARMRRFVSDASHELRTPLASIRGYGELYRMGAVPDGEVGATMSRIENEASRMGGLVNDLLAL
ncbi:histidine kinase dimerization/phospho-acceptor domain-containing protein, partial [Pseudactinotalea sp.]|uniref:histidine kinase dimerization/phospho-acceptor domain-containing protein n=1 Tax=Pseudactinotalea sp. TaxID=1926260 RepID=UPI003B3BB6CC